MTRAEYAERLLKNMAGEDLHLKNMQEEGHPFTGCFGFECPEGHRCMASDDCDTCPYHNYWDKEAETDEKE